jgi:hypothetical protein
MTDSVDTDLLFDAIEHISQTFAFGELGFWTYGARRLTCGHGLSGIYVTVLPIAIHIMM